MAGRGVGGTARAAAVQVHFRVAHPVSLALRCHNVKENQIEIQNGTYAALGALLTVLSHFTLTLDAHTLTGAVHRWSGEVQLPNSQLCSVDTKNRTAVIKTSHPTMTRTVTSRTHPLGPTALAPKPHNP
jgi:hypothetical protein